MKLNVKALALACGLLWGFGIFALTWWIIFFEGATGEPTLIGRLYRGYTISLTGRASLDWSGRSLTGWSAGHSWPGCTTGSREILFK